MRRPKKTKIWGSFDREKGRNVAVQAIRSLRRIQKKMAADGSVSEMSVEQLKYQLDSLDELISHVLPEPGSVSNASISDLFEDEESAAAPLQSDVEK